MSPKDARIPRGASKGEATRPHHAVIRSDGDVIRAKEQGRALATAIGFSAADRVLVATVITELATNIVRYAKHGVIAVRIAEREHTRGITVVASDDGPGIENPGLALRDGYSTSGGLGLGLPGVRRLMDEFHIESAVNGGTTVTVTKWLNSGSLEQAG